MSEASDDFQVVFRESQREILEKWLESVGYELFKIPAGYFDDLVTYGIMKRENI